VEPTKVNTKRLSWNAGWLAVAAICLAGVAAAADQPPASHAPGVAQAPVSAQQPAATPGPEADQGQTVHVVVGHSLMIRTASRVRRILTGNPAVIESVLTSPQELVVTAKQPGGSSLMLWEEKGQNRTLDIFADLDVTSLRNTLDQSFPNSGVEVESQADKVTLVGVVPSAAIAEQMLKMAANFSKEVVNGLQIAQPPRQRQVSLKVRFAEADRGKLSAFGINLFSTGATNTVGTVSTQQFGPTSLSNQNQSGGSLIDRFTQFNLSDLLNIFLFRPDINLGATIKLLQQNQVLQILAEPNLMAISGQPAHFLAGGEFPYPVVQNTGGGAGFGTVTIVFKPYGVKLEFVGTIQDDDTIRLKVTPEVSSLDYANTITISGFTMPAIQTRRAETEIELKDGQSFGIAGLLDQRTTVQLSKVPGIGDIPILGELFKSRNVNKTDSELIVLVTPTIVDPVAGPVPGQPPQVNMPVQNLNTDSFDKGLPSPAKNPGVSK
jgi:pilus assembly protein CpaC